MLHSELKVDPEPAAPHHAPGCIVRTEARVQQGACGHGQVSHQARDQIRARRGVHHHSLCNRGQDTTTSRASGDSAKEEQQEVERGWPQAAVTAPISHGVLAVNECADSGKGRGVKFLGVEVSPLCCTHACCCRRVLNEHGFQMQGKRSRVWVCEETHNGVHKHSK